MLLEIDDDDEDACTVTGTTRVVLAEAEAVWRGLPEEGGDALPVVDIGEEAEDDDAEEAMLGRLMDGCEDIARMLPA